ncbi:MAG: hypothetical protein WCF54_17020 [Terracidiphilus sp.]
MHLNMKSKVLTTLGICLLALPGFCRAANNCTWINEATVSGLLGGMAIVEVTEADTNGTTICEFTQQGDGFKRVFRLTVDVTSEAHARLESLVPSCKIDAFPLKAIGNEAQACTMNDLKSGQGERAIGRVRDQLFTILIYTSLKDDPILTRETLKIRINTAAELVAGNLF